MRTITIALLVVCAFGAAARGNGNDEQVVDSTDSDGALSDYLVVADEVYARRGDNVEFRVFLSAPTPSIAAGFNGIDLTFDREVTIASREPRMRADCIISPEIERPAGFAFEPFGCDPNRSCTFIRVLVLGADESSIPDRAVLFTCRVSISPHARPGWHPFHVQNVEVDDANGNPLPARGVDGGIYVEGDGALQTSDADGCGISPGARGSTDVLSGLGVLAILAVSARIRERARRP